jgi:phage gp45-like
VEIYQEGGARKMSFEYLIESLMAKLRLMVGRCVISASRYKNGELLADIELVAGERRRNVEFLQQFGFSSRHKGDVEGVALFIGGSRDNGVVISTRGECPDLKEGEVRVHSPFGTSITLKNDGSI